MGPAARGRLTMRQPDHITVVDMTLRDGSHANEHQFTVPQVRAVVRALDRAGVPIVEVGHGDGLGASSYNYGFAREDEAALIEAAVDEASRAQICVPLLPGIGTQKEVARAKQLGASVAKVACVCTEADITLQHIALARELGMTTIGLLAMAHLLPPDELAERAALMVDAGAQVICITDTVGVFLPHDARAYVAAARERLPAEVELGFHGHESLCCAVANSLAAIEAGATWIDTCTCAMGAGAGNCPTEVLVAACDRLRLHTGIDTFALMDAAEEVVRTLLPRPQVTDRAALLLAVSGLSSSFLRHVEHAAESYGLPVKDLMLEVGRRKAVVGQEDLIVQVAAEMAQPGA